MPVPDATEFESLLTSLAPEEFVDLVAEVWEARGWTVTREGERLIASADGDRRVVQPVSTGRVRRVLREQLGLPLSVDPDADVVVAATGRAASLLTDVADDAAIHGPGDLRDLLLYGIDREIAADLFERYFDRPVVTEPEPDEPGAVERVSHTIAGFDAATMLAVLAALALIASAAPALLSGSGQPASQVTYSAPETTVGTATPAGEGTDAYPPGVSDGNLTDVEALAEASAGAMGEIPYRVTVDREGTPNASRFGNIYAATWNVTVAGPAHFHYRSYWITDQPDNVSIDLYADGRTKYRRYQEGDTLSYHSYPVSATGDEREFRQRVAAAMRFYLATNESTVKCVHWNESDECITYRILATGEPTAIEENVTDYRAVAFVETDGQLRRLAVSYRLAETGEEVTYEAHYDQPLQVKLTQPEWVADARNATGTSDNETATETTTGGS